MTREILVDHSNFNQITSIMTSSKIYRFKFQDNTINFMNTFAKIHQHDNREDFKEAWELWKDENNEMITMETERLQNMGYKGNVLDKMYKSVRYYYRNKTQVNIERRKETKPRRKYISLGNQVLNSIDRHISMNADKDDFKPADYLIMFVEENLTMLEEEANQMKTKLGISREDYEEKLKKTYKNRHYLHNVRVKNQQECVVQEE